MEEDEEDEGRRGEWKGEEVLGRARCVCTDHVWVSVNTHSVRQDTRCGANHKSVSESFLKRFSSLHRVARTDLCTLTSAIGRRRLGAHRQSLTALPNTEKAGVDDTRGRGRGMTCEMTLRALGHGAISQKSLLIHARR